MTAAGFNIMGHDHPISPVFLEDAKLATNMADRLLEKGDLILHLFYSGAIYVSGITRWVC